MVGMVRSDGSQQFVNGSRPSLDGMSHPLHLVQGGNLLASLPLVALGPERLPQPRCCHKGHEQPA